MAEVSPANPDQPATVSGSVQLRYVNETSTSQRGIYLRLYPNAAAYNEAEMSVSELQVAGTSVTSTLTVDDTVLRVTLPNELAPGQAIDVTFKFAALVPVRPTETFGIFAVDPATGTIALAHWFPLLAGYDDRGWSIDPVSRNGDPIYSNTALFDVSLTTPTGWEVAATGVEIGQQTAGDMTTRRFISGPVRDFTVVTSEQFNVVTRDVAGTTVASYFHPARSAGGEAVLAYGSRALALFSDVLIPYPYREMDLVEVEVYGAGGVEFPQLMYIARSLYDNDHPRNEHYLEFVTAHEVGHQWFYALVGNNQHRYAYIDEGLVEYLSTDVYFSAIYGPETGRRQFALEVLLWYFRILESGRDPIVDQPTDDFPNSAAYAGAAYAKGAIGFAELHELIGDDGFFTALRRYATDYAFRIGDPDALRQAFEVAADRDVDDVWEFWFDQANGAEVFADQDYQELLVELGLR